MKNTPADLLPAATDAAPSPSRSASSPEEEREKRVQEMHAYSHAHGHAHSHEHGHAHQHVHGHGEPSGLPPLHGHEHDGHKGTKHAPDPRHAFRPARPGETVLTVRSFSGLSGDMMLAGMALMAGATQADLDALLERSGLPQLAGSIALHRHSVNSIAGWQCRVDLPHEHAHRTLRDVLAIIERSAFDEKTRTLAASAFALLARAEGAVHGMPPEEVTFHEVGALDSILDICLVCALFTRIAPARFRCSPLPLAEGGVLCAHGWLPTPAPAALELLEGMQVCGFAGKGETVTPTAVALLKTLGAEFGPWPAMTIADKALVYGTKVFPDVPNGALWAVGPAADE